MTANFSFPFRSFLSLLIAILCIAKGEAKPSSGGHPHTFSLTKTVLCIGEQLTVQDTCISDPFQPVARLWTFSQGANTPAVSNQVIANSSFYSPGLKMITLSVYDIFNVGYTDTAYVLIQGSIADAGATKRFCTNTTSVLIGTADTTQANIVWKNNLNSVIGNTRVISVSPTQSAYFYLEVNKNGCLTQDSVWISVNNPPTAIAGTNKIVCNQNAVNLGAASQANLTYQWFPSQGLSDSTIANPLANPSLNTIYTLFVTDTNHCVGNAQVTVNVVNNLVANPGNLASICWGDSIKLGSPQKAGWNYTWTPSLGLNASNLAQPLAFPKATCTYQLMVSAYGCRDSNTVQVIVKPLPVVDLQNRTHLFACKGDSLIIGGSPIAGYHYTWSPLLSINSPNSSFATVFPSQDTYYKLSVLGTNGCRATDSVLIDIYDTIKAFAGLNQSICMGNSIILGAQLQVASGGSGSYNYQWQPSSTLNNATLAHPIAQPSSSTRYLLTVTDKLGLKCGSATDSIDITIYPLPNFQLNFKKIFCKGDSTEQLVASPAGGQFSIVINNSLQPISNALFNPNDTNIQVGVPYLIRYQYTSSQGCTYDTAVSILVKNKPMVNAGNDLFYCPASGHYNNQLLGYGTGSATWQPNNLLSNDSIFNPLVTSTQSQNFILTVNNGGCSAADTVAFVVCTDSVYLRANYDRLSTTINTGKRILIEGNDSSSINKYLNSQFLLSKGCQHGIGFINQQTNAVEFNYTPNANFVGHDTAIYILRDTFGLRSYEDTALILISVSPIATNDSLSSLNGSINCESPIFTVHGNDLFNANTAATIELMGSGKHGTFTVNGLQIGYQTTDKVVKDNIDYILSQNGLSDTATISIDFNCPACKCGLPEGFSPNNDGKNDYLDLLQTNNCIPDCSLIIYNRWGNVVYQSEHYDRKWDGKYNGADLPDGTYYYLISNKEKEVKSNAGFLILQR